MSTDDFSSQAKVKRRDRFGILSAILLNADKGVRQTQLMIRVGMVSSQFDNYVRLLLKSELVEISKNLGDTVFTTTKKGKKFVNNFCTLVKLLDSEKSSDLAPLFSPPKP